MSQLTLQLLGLEMSEIQDNLVQLFLMYFLLVDIPVVIPTGNTPSRPHR